MPKLLLINPARKKANWIRKFQVPPVQLLQLAALAPPHWEIGIVDEYLDELPRDFDADLVGVSAITCQARRGYEIARRAREQRIPVVMGGIHPSSLPGEALQHADAVVVGEAEPVFRKVLGDFEAGDLKPLYDGGTETPLDGYPFPRWDAVPLDKYRLTRHAVQTARGCPWDCVFCSTARLFGKKYRFRPVDKVIGEIAAMEGRFLLFLDDNINGNNAYCKELFRAMIPLGKRWASQASLVMANDDELLRLARESGCIGLYIGFDSVQPNVKSGLKKYRGIVSIEDSVRKIQEAHGIPVEGSFVFGFDEDDPGVFERTVRWAQRMHLANATFQILTPHPGTGIHDALRAEGRIISYDWDLYNQCRVVIRPKRMTPERLYEGFLWARKEFYTWGSIVRRLAHLPGPRARLLAYNCLRRGAIANLPPSF